MNWQPQKLCTDVGAYELLVEKQKTHAGCEQKKESWRWAIAIHGAHVASGSVNSLEDAQSAAIANVPMNAPTDRNK